MFDQRRHDIAGHVTSRQGDQFSAHMEVTTSDIDDDRFRTPANQIGANGRDIRFNQAFIAASGPRVEAPSKDMTTPHLLSVDSFKDIARRLTRQLSLQSF